MKYIMRIVLLYSCYISTIYSQSITISPTIYNCLGDDNKYHPFHSYCYSINNNDTSYAAIFFIEEDNTALSHKTLLHKKLFRRYGDFYLAMFVTDNVMFEDSVPCIPEYFVKVLSPGDTFNIYLYADIENDNLLEDFEKHILICKEDELESIGLHNFMIRLQEDNITYPYSYIIMSVERFKHFITRYRK